MVASGDRNLDWFWVPEGEYGGQPGEIASKIFRAVGDLTDAEFLARESVQNSWDAAQTFRKTEGDHDIPFSVTFRFVEHTGTQKRELIDRLGLRGLNSRRAAYGDGDELPVRVGTLLDHLDDDTPLRLLYVEDRGSHGLFGPLSWKRKSHLFKAMLTLGSSAKEVGDGGSYGFGKAALQKAGRLHTVYAHTTFRPQPGDLSAYSRFLGVTWWPQHDFKGEEYEGKALFAEMQQFGNDGTPRAVPFTNAAADRLATEAGFPPRDPDNPADMGTTFLIVDPAVNAAELKTALEKWWWPGLASHLISLSIKDYDGERTVPRPGENPFVRQFIPAYRIALKLDEPRDKNKERRPSDGWRGGDFGGLGLVVPESPVGEAGDEFDGRPRVALIRGPRMVIAYRTGRSPRRVPVVGAFVASDESNQLLRLAEPASHTHWEERPSTEIAPEATARVKAVHSRVDNAVTDMVNDIIPPPPRDNRALSTFSKLLAGFVGNKAGRIPPPPGGEPISLRFVSAPKVEEAGEGLLKMTATFAVSASANAPGSGAAVTVGCSLRILEDETKQGAFWDVTVKPSGSGPKFTKADSGTWTGRITKSEKATFKVESAPYSSLWSAALEPSVTRTSAWSDDA